MPDIGTAYVQIKPTTKGIAGDIEKELSGVQESGDKVGSGFASKLKSAILAAGIGSAVTSALKTSLEAGGALQQSFIGGLDTLYGGAADQMRTFAMEAAQAGISANDYAEQAVSFGASLKSAFGGDTVKAAEAANTAIMDMADNSAKMGTDITAVQTAYAGFAKQNYTMLDNLKLGYGGTKTEMERLLKEAEKLSGVKYDINNLGDVYEAIHVIQKDLHLTGVAADEASTTLTGSLGAVKASFQNFMGSLSAGLDITQPLTNMITSASTFLFGNLLPMVGNIVSALPAAFTTAFQTIAPMLGTAVQTIINATPGFLQSGFDMISRFVDGIILNMPTMILGATQAIQGFLNYISQNLPLVLQKGVEIINKLVRGILDNLPLLIQSAGKAVSSFVQFIIQNLPKVLQAGVKILVNLVQGIIDNFPKIVQSANDALTEFRQTILDNLDSVFEKGQEILSKVVKGIEDKFTDIKTSAKDAIDEFIAGIKDKFSDVKKKGKDLIDKVIAGVKEKFTAFKTSATDAISKFTSAFTEKDWGSIGSDILSGIAKGISAGASTIVEAAKSAASAAFEAAKSFLGIASPSKLFEKEVGRWIPAGIAVGIKKNTGILTGAISDLTDRADVTFTSSFGRYDAAHYQSAGGSGYNQTVNIYSPTELTPSEVARQTRLSTQQMILGIRGI